MQIRKYQLNTEPLQFIDMPAGAKILTAQVQRDVPVLWAMVDEHAETVQRAIALRKTGECMSYYAALDNYIATLQLCDGLVVYHVFA